jgi:hypothetical protein
MPVQCWLQDSHARVFPAGNRVGPSVAHIEAARGERVSLQLCACNGSGEGVVGVRAAIEPVAGLSTRLRRVGFIPLLHSTTETESRELDCRGKIPGFVPDPLFDEEEAEIARGQTAAFWITITVGPRCSAGRKIVPFTVESRGSPVGRLHAVLFVRELAVAPRRGFPVLQVLRSDALLDRYGLAGFDKGYWDLAGAYMEDLSAHGHDAVNVPVFGGPQLLRVTRRGGTYGLDWTDVKRYVSLARSRGIRWFQWPPLSGPGDRGLAPALLEGQAGKPLWGPRTPAFSPAHRAFLSQYLPRLSRFLHVESLADCSLFRLSDSPCNAEALPSFRRAREALRRLAPWVKTTDLVSDVEAARSGLVDMPAVDMGAARQLIHEGIPCFAALGSRPRGSYPSRFLDTPLAKVRIIGWLLYRFRLRGFLGAGYNDWYTSGTRALVDPFTESSGRAWPSVPAGELFLVYPGPRGPIDSIRWEIFGEGLSDYALLASAGMPASARTLSAIRNFHRFPRDPAWVRKARHEAFSLATTRSRR